MKAKKGVTIRIASELLGVSVNTLRNWDASGKFTAYRAKNGYRYYHIREIVMFAKKNDIKIRTMKNPSD
tara:strand:- start:1669 stop:1875 length:207 start_codon:yes stop_codon:yes gene_type:complete